MDRRKNNLIELAENSLKEFENSAPFKLDTHDYLLLRAVIQSACLTAFIQGEESGVSKAEEMINRFFKEGK